MAEYSNTGRVMGRSMGRYADAGTTKGVARPKQTPEQKEQAEAANLRSYQAWKAERDARIERMKKYRLSKLHHKDIVM